jgi:hypothetical protein
MQTAPPGWLPGPGTKPEAVIREARRRQRRRWLAAGVATAAVLVAAGAVIAGSGAGSHPRPPGRHASTAPKPAPSVMRGLPMPAGSGVRLLLTGRRPAWFSMATRRTEPIKGLPWNRAGYGFTRVSGGWSAQPYPAGPYPAGPGCLPVCAGPPLPSYFIADGSASAARIGPGFGVSASDGNGMVWLVTFRRSADNIDTTPARAQQVTTAGRPAGPRFRLPAGYLIQRAVGGDLLLAPVDQGPGTVTYKLWDPGTRRVAGTFSDVIAASPRQIAWGPVCVHCPVHVLNLLTGTTAAIPVPRETWANNNGTFSSDGRFLAFSLSAGPPPPAAAAVTRIAVIDIASRRLLAVPGTTLSGAAAGRLSFGWQASGHRLIAVLPRPGQAIQVASWQPGAAHLWVATARIPRGTSPVLGEYG